MNTLYKTLCKILNNIEAEDSGIQDSPHCCLCLADLEGREDKADVNDEVFYDTNNHPATETLATMIHEVLGEQVFQMMTVFTSVCGACSSALIFSYKFKQQCKQNTKNFINAFNNIDDCFSNVTEDLYNYKALYISINMNNQSIEQIYNVNQVTKDTVLSNFQQIFNQNEIKKSETQRRKRDFSTIFIKTHELMADPNKKEFKCKLCSKVYPTGGGLRLHFFSLHFKKEFQCKSCPRSFGTEGLLLTHVKESHSFVKCHKCHKNLKNRTSTLRRHAMSHEQQNKVCHRCGRKYTKRTDFLKHLNQTSCVMPSRIAGDYNCNDCGKHFKFKHQLASHLKYEHGNAEGHICKWCGRKCYTASALKTHILKHTGEKNFICDECGGKFVTKQSLLNHTRLHTGERPYPCQLCDHSFLSASRRKEHIERYHANCKFECDICNAIFLSRRTLLQHRKKHFLSES